MLWIHWKEYGGGKREYYAPYEAPYWSRGMVREFPGGTRCYVYDLILSDCCVEEGLGI